MPGKKVPERHSGLRPEKELLERCSGEFRHKNIPAYTFS
jgi:hypothetical protein